MRKSRRNRNEPHDTFAVVPMSYKAKLADEIVRNEHRAAPKYDRIFYASRATRFPVEFLSA